MPRPARTRRALLALLGAAAPLLLAAALAEGAWARWLFALLAAAFPVALMALGALRRDRLGPLAGVFLALFGILAAGLAALLALAGEGADAPRLGGLPPAAAIQIYGLALLPLALVSLAYALTFDRRGLTREDLENLRERLEEGSGEGLRKRRDRGAETAPPGGEGG